MVTMEFIARKSGMSRYTVSRALSGNPKVAPETRARILAVCEKYGYIPNCNAVGLVKGRTNLVGVAVPYLTDDFYSEIVEFLDRNAQRHDFQLIYRSSYNDSRIEAEILRSFLSLKVCAMILVPVVVNPDSKVHELAGKNVPVVYFDRPWREDSFHVINDNHQGTMTVTELLLKNGSIPAYLGSFYRGSNVTACERESGYCDAMKKHGLAPRLLDCTFSDQKQDNEQFGYDNTRQVIASKKIPDAIVCVTDAVALGAMRALKEAGIIPGRDILITGHDNLRFSAFLSPSLTTVRQRKDLFAPCCLEIIKRCLESDIPEQKKYVFSPEIIERESSRKQ